MSKWLTARFVALYVALGIFGACAIAGAVALALTPSTRAQISHVQAQLGDTNLTRLADKYIAQQAQAQGFAVVKIVVLHTETHGNDAKVTARVTVTDGIQQQTVELVVSFTRGVWSATNMAAA